MLPLILPFVTLISLICLTLQRKSLLMSLLCLEAMILSLALFMSLTNTNMNEIFFMLIILTFGACEASLGLACLVAMTRSYGSDRLKSLSTNKC